jgi:hypothetical protein
MVFLIVHDGGIVTKPFVASDLAAAAELIRQEVGAGVGIDRSQPVQVAIVIPDAIATVTPNTDPTLATIDATFQTAAANRAALVTRAQAALAANDTFLALNAPTNAQTLAQVKMLTKECSALIRLAIGALDTTAGT